MALVGSGPLEADGTEVTVAGISISPAASLVTVYADGVPIGTADPAGSSGCCRCRELLNAFQETESLLRRELSSDEDNSESGPEPDNPDGRLPLIEIDNAHVGPGSAP